MSLTKNDSQANHAMSGVDSYAPAEIARLVESNGVTKAHAPALTTLALAVLAGAFIALGGVFSTIIGTDSTLGFGPTRLLMGLGFSLGLILVVIAGAELFTGNNLLTMSWVSGHITLAELLCNWAIVYAGNLIGALSVVFMVYAGGWWQQDGFQLGATAVDIALAKARLTFVEALVRGILANVLVCLAVWLASSCRTAGEKILAIVFPISAFVASGFEHSIANMYFIPLGLLLAGSADILSVAALDAERLSFLTVPALLNNLAASTLGNAIGGGLLVGLVYWFIYLRETGRKEGKP